MNQSNEGNHGYYSFKWMNLCDYFKLVNSLLSFLIVINGDPEVDKSWSLSCCFMIVNPGHDIVAMKSWSLYCFIVMILVVLMLISIIAVLPVLKHRRSRTRSDIRSPSIISIIFLTGMPYILVLQ